MCPQTAGIHDVFEQADHRSKTWESMMFPAPKTLEITISCQISVGIRDVFEGSAHRSENVEIRDGFVDSQEGKSDV